MLSPPNLSNVVIKLLGVRFPVEAELWWSNNLSLGDFYIEAKEIQGMQCIIWIHRHFAPGVSIYWKGKKRRVYWISTPFPLHFWNFEFRSDSFLFGRADTLARLVGRTECQTRLLNFQKHWSGQNIVRTPSNTINTCCRRLALKWLIQCEIEFIVRGV